MFELKGERDNSFINKFNVLCTVWPGVAGYFSLDKLISCQFVQ